MEEIKKLLQAMARLRDPKSGCPWDRAQTFASLVPCTLEEAYEVADSVAREDLTELKEELGDLLFQVVFYARIAEEAGAFAFEDVAAVMTEKLIRRHPHVFGEASYADIAEQSVAWEQIKAEERGGGTVSALDGVPQALPALMRAVKLQRRAARVGFDWSDLEPVFDKIAEEIGEIREATQTHAGAERVADEVGDLLFACANLARHLDVDPETALRDANSRFQKRFRYIEDGLAKADRTPQQASLEEMDALWEQAKVADIQTKK